VVPSFRALRLCGGLALALAACATAPPTITKVVGGRQIATRGVDPDAYEHVARALLLEEEGRAAAAATELRLAIALDGDAPELQAHLAELLLHDGKLDEAAAAVRASLAIAKTANGLLAEAHLRRAEGNVKGVVAALRQATAEVDFRAEDDEAEDVYLELADAELQGLEVPAARHTLEVLTAAEPGSGTGHMRLCAVYWAEGKMAKAEAELHAALAEEPNQIEALAALAWIDVATGRDTEARKSFREALDRSEGALEIAAAFARFLVASGNGKEAEQLADDLAVPRGSLDRETLAGRVELERSAHRYERALALLAQGRELGIAEDEKNRFSLVRAALLKEAGKPGDAIAALLEVAKTSPIFFESRLRAAELYRDSGKVDDATRVVEEAARLTEGDRETIEVEAAVSLALTDEKRGNAAAGVERLRKVLQRYPDEARPIMALGALEERRGRWQEALAVVEHYLQKHPGSVEALNFWGFVAADHGHTLDLAAKRLQVASSLDPGSGGLLDSLGWVRFRTKDLAMAAMFLEQAARLEPSDPEIQWHLGEVCAARQESARAAGIFRRALGLSPDERVRRQLEDSLARVAGRRVSGK
jgi:tetratricopeptide (TPR) repeat protein